MCFKPGILIKTKLTQIRINVFCPKGYDDPYACGQDFTL